MGGPTFASTIMEIIYPITEEALCALTSKVKKTEPKYFVEHYIDKVVSNIIAALY